jgi:UPF0716 protein FxsA
VILAFLPIVWLLAELFVAIGVAHAIGAGYMLLALIVSWPLGGWALRSQGRAAWRRLSAAVAAGRPPGREAIDGALVLIGAILLIVPGFITDGIGLLLLLAPTRAVARQAITRNFQSRLVVAATRFSRAPGSAYDVDSTATDLDGPQLQP